MRSTPLALCLAVSATVLGSWHHPKSEHGPKFARDIGTADDASKACADIKSQISSASEVIDGLGKCSACINADLWSTAFYYIGDHAI